MAVNPPDTVILRAAPDARAAGLDPGRRLGRRMLDGRCQTDRRACRKRPTCCWYVGNWQCSRAPPTVDPGADHGWHRLRSASNCDCYHWHHQKMGMVSPLLNGDLVLPEACLPVGLPTQVTAVTSIDAMRHALDAYTCRLRRNPLSNMPAIQALRLLSASLVAVCENGGNLAARQAMLLSAMLAKHAFSNARSQLSLYWPTQSAAFFMSLAPCRAVIGGTGRNCRPRCARQHREPAHGADRRHTGIGTERWHRDPTAGGWYGRKPYRSPGRRRHAADTSADQQPARATAGRCACNLHRSTVGNLASMRTYACWQPKGGTATPPIARRPRHSRPGFHRACAHLTLPPSP